jgi:NAD(P)-dependent dehydrogenase (short-subunit alcohol dehydrogenase family)
MDLNLRDKVAIVTGVSGKNGGSGVGAAICEEFAKEGINVVANYIVDEKDTIEFIENINRKYGTKGIAVYGDISSTSDIDNILEQTVKTFKRIDILVNNAGILPVTDILDMPDEEWERVIKINLNGTYFFSKRFAQKLVSMKRPGRILNISSKSGISVSSPSRSHYATSKGAIITLTKAMARELTKYGIIVNAIVPGILRTPLNEDLFKDPNVEKNYVKRIALGRLTEPREIAQVVTFFVSDKTESTPGSIIDVTGGMLL